MHIFESMPLSSVLDSPPIIISSCGSFVLFITFMITVALMDIAVLIESLSNSIVSRSGFKPYSSGGAIFASSLSSLAVSFDGFVVLFATVGRVKLFLLGLRSFGTILG